jgi:O-antigen ligase
MIYYIIQDINTDSILKNIIKYIDLAIITVVTFQLLNINKEKFKKFFLIFCVVAFIVKYLINDKTNISTFLHYSHFLIIFYALFYLKKNNKYNWIIYLLAIIISVIAQSRGSLIIIFSTLLYEYIEKILNIKNSKKDIIKKVLVICIALAIGFVGINYFTNELSKESASNIERNLLINTAIDIAKNNFIIGVGPGNFSRYAINNYGLNISQDLSVHNYFLEVLVEYGIIGFIVMIIPYIYILKNIITFKGKMENNKIAIYLIVFLFFNVLSGDFRLIYGIMMGISLLDVQKSSVCIKNNEKKE